VTKSEFLLKFQSAPPADAILGKALNHTENRPQRDYIPMHHYLHKTEKPHAADWGYTGRTGPEHWGDLCPQYVLAKTGRLCAVIKGNNRPVQPLNGRQVARSLPQ